MFFKFLAEVFIESFVFTNLNNCPSGGTFGKQSYYIKSKIFKSKLYNTCMKGLKKTVLNFFKLKSTMTTQRHMSLCTENYKLLSQLILGFVSTNLLSNKLLSSLDEAAVNKQI